MTASRFRTLFFALSIWCCCPAAATWLFGSHHELVGYTIMEVGDVSKNHWYDPETLQRLEWFEFKSYHTQCFLIPGEDFFMSSYSTIPSLLLKKVVGEDVVVKVALLEHSFGGLSVDVKSVRFVSCPDFYPY